MVQDIVLHQTLHGYGDGHQLLAASLELTREQQWQLLVMTDLSGPSFRVGFESYISGYPLVGGGYYCLSKTWYASELPRPGCVWTHTLLFSDTDLARIQDFRGILSCFKRPFSGGGFDGYATKTWAKEELSNSQKVDRNTGAAVLHDLYQGVSKTVSLTSQSSVVFEGLLIEIFSQQWPRLRRNFSFCTGALASRDIPFDLVVAPPDAMRQGEKWALIMPHDGNGPISKFYREDWIRVAIEDIATANPQSNLRQFLWKYGPDYPNGRAVFRALTEIYLAASNNPESVEQALSATAHFFPDPVSSNRLKTEFFGAGGSSKFTSFNEESVLRTLVAHPAASCISDAVADIKNRAQLLTTENTDAAEIIASSALSMGGRRSDNFIDGFAAGIDSHPEKVASIGVSLVLELVKRRPAFMAMPELWKRHVKEQLAIVAHIVALPFNDELGKDVTRAVLVAKAWPALTGILAHFGRAAIKAVLVWVDETGRSPVSLPKGVMRALAEYPFSVADVIRKSSLEGLSLCLATVLLDPRADDIRSLGVAPWLKVVKRGVHLSSREDELRSRTFMLSLGLSLHEPDTTTLVRESFSAIYEAARDDKLEDGLWQFLEPHLPWYHVDWDRCARLIRGGVENCTTRDWRVEDFIATFATEEQFERALAEADRTYSGSRYVRKICMRIKEEPSLLSARYQDLLDKFCYSGWF